MGTSEELQNLFEARSGIHFGLTSKTVPLGSGVAFNKDTAVKAICVSTNEENREMAWELLLKWYYLDKPVFPLGIPMMFVPSKDHPHIMHNPQAAQNISTLLDRQQIFLHDTDLIPCPALAFPDEPTAKPGNRTL